MLILTRQFWGIFDWFYVFIIGHFSCFLTAKVIWLGYQTLHSLSYWLMDIVLRFVRQVQRTMFSLRLIISPSWDSALLCILLNGCKSWDLPIWPVGTNLVFGPMFMLGAIINNHFQWFFIHSQVVSLTACADLANKLKQL